MYTKPNMQSKSHFLAHFIPGMLLGSVVGMAFGSLLVASQIKIPAKSDSGAQSGSLDVKPSGGSRELITVHDAKNLFTMQYSSAISFAEKPVVTEVKCGSDPLPEGYSSWPVQPTSEFINDVVYRKYLLQEGAAGTTYSSTYYFAQQGNVCLEIHWSYGKANCLNYPEGHRSACYQANEYIDVEVRPIPRTFQFSYPSDWPRAVVSDKLEVFLDGSLYASVPLPLAGGGSAFVSPDGNKIAVLTDWISPGVEGDPTDFTQDVWIFDMKTKALSHYPDLSKPYEATMNPGDRALIIYGWKANGALDIEVSAEDCSVAAVPNIPCSSTRR